MAASSSTSSTAVKQYDVFISFRGEDTRDNFTSHLYSALSRNSIGAYMDHQLNKGDEISPALIQAIQDSYGSLVVFSENYASSRWCLNELLEILECRKQGHFVIPVFYKIDPSHVRKQTASYGEAFTKHEQHSNNKNMLQKWKAALVEAANIAGWDSQSRTNRNESELIQDIVKDVLDKLDHIYKPSESGLVGIDKHCEKVEPLLQRFPVVGIWGMGGIGKTIIAKAVFDKLSSQYDSCCFLENVREESQRSGLNQLHGKLLSNLLKDDTIPVNPHKDAELKHAMRRLSSKKVFIILDDVNCSSQLKILERECNCLGPKSRVIITTRDKHLLIGLSVQHVIYEVERLDFEESLLLFRLIAFNENYPDIGYEELSKKFVDYAKGTPLALKVLGSFLLSKSREEWESAWQKLNKIPNEDIGKVLRWSFDELNHEEKQIFLDIAHFFKGEHKEKVKSLLDSFGFYGAIGIRTLQNKALITISYSNIVQMHDLIQKMGWEIVRMESIEESGRRSRLLNSEEVYDVLKYNKGTSVIQGIILDMSQIKDLQLSVKTFKKMINLRFLKFYLGNYGESCKVHLPINIQTFFDKLRCFHWEGYPLQSLPSNFCAEKLVELHMPHSHIKELWNGVQDLVNLKSLDLSESEQLMGLPDFSKASSLRSVDLSGCTNLHHIHPSILSLHTLETLDLEWCKGLKSLQSEAHLKSLTYLNVMNCSSLKKFSLTSDVIRDLVIEETAIENLHSSIRRCSNLRDLTLCDSFKNLPSNLSKLTSLQSLSVIGCRELNTQNLHAVLESLKILRELTLIDCFNLFQLPNNIMYLAYLSHLEIRNCSGLLCISELPLDMETLLVINCKSLETVSGGLPFRSLFTNCVTLDRHSLSCIINKINVSVRSSYFRPNPQLAQFLPEKRELHQYGFFLPANGVRICFKDRATQNRITIDIPQPSDLINFVFYCILSPEFLPSGGKNLGECGCTCYSEHGWLAKFPGSIDLFADAIDTELISDHVYVWYGVLRKDRFFDAMRGKSAESQSTIKLFFEFYVYANRHQSIMMENGIKECGVWPVYSLLDKSNHTNVEEPFFELTSENFKLSWLPLELEFDDLEPNPNGAGVTSSVFGQDISVQRAKQDLLEINAPSLHNSFKKSDCSTSQMEVNLESGLGDKSKRCREMDDNQQLRRKKSNRCQDIDELLGGASTTGIGVGCSEFDCVNHYELQPLAHTNTTNEFVYQPPPTDISMQNLYLDSTQMNSTFLLDQFSDYNNNIMQFGPTGFCPDFNEMVRGSNSLGVDQQSPSLSLWLNQGDPQMNPFDIGANSGLYASSCSSSLPDNVQTKEIP